MLRTARLIMLAVLSGGIFAVPCGIYAQSAPRTVSGTVTDAATGEPLIGATVQVKGVTIGTTTDLNGMFSINLPANRKTLLFSYVGYEAQEIAVGRENYLNVALKQDANALDEVVVVGYGQQKKGMLVSSVQSIAPAELRMPSSSLSTGFAGRLAGVIAVQRNGQPGADQADFWIRGISTFGSATKPLIILDGVAIDANELNGLDPEIIESFSVLKDATATALYGSRGANGVMIITTKNGRDSEKMTINLRAEFGASAPTRVPKVADGITYMETFNEARTTRGEKPYYSNEKIMGTKLGLDPYVYPNVDWYDMLFKDCTFNQNFNFNMTGGAKKIDYFLNASVYNENGIMRKPEASKFDTNINAQKYLFQANVSADATKTTRVSLKMNTQLHYRHAPIQSVSDLFAYAMPRVLAKRVR